MIIWSFARRTRLQALLVVVVAGHKRVCIRDLLEAVNRFDDYGATEPVHAYLKSPHR